MDNRDLFKGCYLPEFNGILLKFKEEFRNFTVMANAEPELAEIGTIVTSLKEGTTMTRFYSNKRPETRIFLLKLDEFQIAWWRNAGKEEGTGVYGPDEIHSLCKVN